MKAKIFVTALILISLFTPVLVSTDTAEASSDYIIFRSEVAPMYIKNETVYIRVQALVFRGNKPTAQSCNVKAKIEGIDSNFKYTEKFDVKPGRKVTKNMIQLPVGHYEIQLQAVKGDLSSKKVVQDFGVSEAPIPYHLSFSSGGSAINFKSKKLNSTGHIDPDFPFTLKIYRYRHGQGETLIRTVKNVTDVRLDVKESWRSGILIVHVIDRFGWRNSADMDISELQFSGTPEQYDYEQTHRQPYKARQPWYLAFVFGSLIIMFIAGSKLREKYE